MTESILRLDRVEKADGSPVDLTKQSALKAYANLNGEMASVRDSFNLSSVADKGVGNYTFNLASAMSGAGYAPTMSVSNWVGANAVRVVEINSDANITATSIPILTSYLNTTNDRTLSNEAYVTLAVAGELA